jgi:hypothetical protein
LLSIENPNCYALIVSTKLQSNQSKTPPVN